jgi:glycosyltransferase involved in cell wall biosynthesis
MKKLIYIAYTFPPVSTGSAPMNLRLADIFMRNGWLPSIVTLDHTATLPVDNSLLALLPEEMNVIRSGKSGRLRRRKSPLPGKTGSEKTERKGLRKLILEGILQPDRYVTWVPRAISATLREIDRTGAELIVTLGPPHSVHLAGLVCSRLTGKPWVAYFGDLWARDGYINWHSLSRARRFMTPIIERAVVRSADGIITTTDGSSRYFTEKYGGECPPVQTLWNGVTLEERKKQWNSEGPREPGDDLVITYTGFFMGNQTPEHFLRGMRMFLDKHPGSGFRFRIVGDFGAYADLPEKLGLKDSVDVIGAVPFTEVRKWQLDSDVLLLVLRPQPGNELKNPSKTVEYLLARRPILAVTPEGDLTGLIERLGAGYTATHDAGSVCDSLEEIQRDIRAGKFRVLSDPSDLDGDMDMDLGGRRMVEFLERIVDN